MSRKAVFSGVQPSGTLTIGNYLGALRNFVELQDEFDCYYCIVDLHAITIPQIAEKLKANTLDVLSLYMAVGMDPEKSTLFIQSHVPAHTELTWVLNTLTYMGQLNRMTQFKEKSRKSDENLNAGLFTYPVLMAADILLYQTNYVPVGEDQKQHLELARDLAERFNNRYGETFIVPEPLIKEFGARIMSLQDPLSKMSKSDADENAFILMLDERDSVVKKIKRAVTDSVGVVAYSDEQPGLKNLLNIYSVLSGDSVEEIVNNYEGKGYGKFKTDLAEIVIDALTPIQDRYKEYRNDPSFLQGVYKNAAERAELKAQETLRDVYDKVGFIPRR
ncbi:MAG: tryptophan--tRNA ligase [Gudongella sp.]|jgi:tryptophanyl-tRNA synthetase|nr:tryptophan--tRNA ligase [Gudongella sp.]